jgi:hypothetical protein
MKRSAWRALQDRARSEAADTIADKLAKRNIQRAELKIGNRVAIDIQNGLVMRIAEDL